MSLRARIAAHENTPEQRQPRRRTATWSPPTGPSCWRRSTSPRCRALAAAERRARLERVLGHIISREGPVLSTAERAALIRRVVDEALGLGILEPLLEDASITEIMVNGPDRDLRRARRPGRAGARPLLLRRPADADHRAHRLHRQPPGGRVQPDGRRAAALRRAGQRHHPAAVADRRHPHHPPLPARLHAPGADRAGHAGRAHAAAAVRLRPGQVQHHRLRRYGHRARPPCSTRCPG